MRSLHHVGGFVNYLIAHFPPREGIKALLEADKKNRHLITFNYYSVIFRNRTEVLQDLPDKLINNIIEFYGTLEALVVDVASLEGKAFETISPAGRENLVLSILEDQKVALKEGQSLLSSIEHRVRPFRE